uniref:Uncharacterized protein n=1 Tax=uncultured Caudovirales phage TaxID=2100421 RepID=A0A6J5L3V0_9CAUD|nr:hypothetical protein UFOVP114_33 [uncultured Caudovirales phage]
MRFLCPKCDAEMRTVDCRSGTSQDTRRAGLLEPIRRVWGWWSNTDFFARQRRCPKCQNTVVTVEISLADLEGSIADAAARAPSGVGRSSKTAPVPAAAPG